MDDDWDQQMADLEHLATNCPGLAGGCESCNDMVERMRRQPPRPTPLPDPRTTFTCPDCRSVTRLPEDVKNSYCPRCHLFYFDDVSKLRCFEPTCPDFGDRSFGEGTCPSEHAVPPARRPR